MAQLKDTLIQGSARVTDTLYTTTLFVTNLLAPTSDGGTTFGPGTDGYILKSNGTSIYWTSVGNAIGYSVTDRTSATAIGTGTGLMTERAVHYGLPTINNAHNYTSSTTIYAPTAGGTANYILWANGATSTPTWKAPKDALNYMINQLDTGSSALTANDYVITQYVGGGTTTTTYHRRPASAVINKTLIDAALGTSTTANFYRGDKTWSNTIKQTANAALGIDSSTLKIGAARKDLNFDIVNGSGTGVNDGYAGGITWGNGTSAYAGIYYQSSSSYGTRLIFATTGSYANGSYARMIVQSNGYIGIGTLSPDTLLTVNGNAKATKFIGALEGNVTGNCSGTAGSVAWSNVTDKPSSFYTFADGTGGFSVTPFGGSASTISIGTIPVSQGGTNITSYTIGDILYASAATTLSKLTGNTTTTNKFLRSVAATSGTAVAPTWAAVTKTDVGLSDVENTKLSTWTGTNKITTVGTITTGTWHGTAIASAYIGSHGEHVTTATVKTALGTVSTTAKKFLKDTGSWVQVDWGDLTSKPTTISGYGITDAKIASGVITLGSNTITPLTASSTLDATKLSGTIPTSCYTNSRDAGYGGIAPTNSTAVTALTGNTTATAAKTYNETLKVIAKNKWVVFAGSNSSTAGSDELQVAHALSGVTAGTSSPSSAQTPDYNATFNIPTITVDAAGHVTAMSTTTVQIPAIPTASASVAGITKVGASGGAAAYSHGTHVTTATVKTALGTDSTATTFLRKDGTWSNILSTSSTTLTDNASLSFAKTSVNLKNSKNNVSSGESYLGSLLFTDANSLPAGAIQTIVNATGQSVLSLMALAYNSSGTAVISPALQIIANKDGSNGYYVNNPAAFRMAINVPDSFDYLPLSGGTMTGQITTTASTQSTAVIKPNSNQYGTIGSSTLEYYGIYANTTISSVIRARNYEPKANTGSDRGMYYGFSYCSGHYYYINAAGSGNGTFVSYIDSNGVHAAVWNDFAEYRKSNIIEPGRVVVEDINDTMVLATERLQPCAKIISDTFGMSVGKSDKANTPIGVAGRVLAYTYQNRNNYHIGDCVCSAPNGTVDIMSREEIKEFPDRIIGIVSQIPDYELWENTITDNTGRVSKSTPIEVKNRIWIYVK